MSLSSDCSLTPIAACPKPPSSTDAHGGHRICWLTPDYFLNVDAGIVPRLAGRYSIDWLLLGTPNSSRASTGLLSTPVRPIEFTLKYRQRDPRIVSQYVSLLSHIRKRRYALLYTSFHGLPYFFPVLSALLDADRVIYGVHNVHTPRGATHERFMQVYQRYAFSVLKRFHVFSPSQLEAITSLLPNKRHYYAPLAPEDYGPSSAVPPTDRIRFLSFGYIRRYKRLDLLIRSFREVYSKSSVPIELVIAGRCDHWEEYEPMIAGHPAIRARIGVVPNRDIPDLISSSHYLVLPYQDSAQSGVVSLAYRYHKPVITSDITAFRQAVVPGDTGFLFESLSQTSLEAVLHSAIRAHDEVYPRLTERVRQHVARECSTEAIVEQYAAFLDDALAGVPDSNTGRGPCKR